VIPDALKLGPSDSMQDDTCDDECERQVKDDARQAQVHDIATRLARRKTT
jgi:hypothetical protein